MRKIISLILISVIVISAIPVLSVSANTEAKCDEDLFNEASQVLSGIGCVDVSAKKDQSITRDAWLNLMLDHSYYDGVDKATLATSGIYSETNYYFHPDESITLGDAVTMLVKLLGFMPGVEYNKSVYLNTAVRLDIDNGINASFDDYVTYEMAYILLFNYLNANTAELNISTDSVYVKDSGKSILESKYDITTVFGQITSSESYSLSSDEGDGEGFLTLEGMKCKNNRYNSDDYFAKYVTAYIRDYKNSNEVIALVEDSRSKVIEINHENGASIQNDKVSYYNEDGKLKTKGISVYAQIFRNGEKVVYDEDKLLPECGTLTLIDNGTYSDGADVVIIESVTDVKIESIKKDTQKVYCEGALSYVIDDNVSLESIDGAGADFESLTSGDILSVWEKSDGSLWKAVLCTNSVTGTITEVSSDSFLIDTQKYTLSSSRKSIVSNSVEPGKSVYAVINVYGQVADLTEDISSGDLCGIMMQYSHKNSGLSEKLAIRIYDTNEIFSSYEVRENAVINGKRCKSYDEIIDNLPKIANSDVLRQTMILYKLDENDKIISIEYSSDEIMDLDSESKLYLVGKTEKSNAYTGTYKRYSKYFGPNIFVEPGQTLMFKYPIQSTYGELHDEEDLYSVTSLNSVVSGSSFQNCTITGYSIDPNSKVARYITVEYEAESGAGNTVGGDTRIAMVGEVKKCVWRDEYVEAVTIYNSRSVSGTTVYGKNDNYFTNLGIESGDIIRVDYSGETKTVNAVEVIWENGSETLANGTYTFGSDGSICDVRFCKVYKNWGVVSDVFPKNTDLATVSSKDAKTVRTDLYMIFKYNKKLGKVETLSYRDIMAYEVAGEDASDIIYEMRYYDPMSMFVVE